MIILDWRHPFLACSSLGNIVGAAYASEYIIQRSKVPIGIIPADWHMGVWPLCVSQKQLFIKPQWDDEVILCRPALRKDQNKQQFNWIQYHVTCTGFDMPDEDKIDPKICWMHSRNSRRILLYPREYNNKNVYFTLDYWIGIGKILLQNSWSIVAILDNQYSNRDGDYSSKWCNEFKDQVKCEYIFPPTIGGLQAAVGLSEVSIGILNGAGLLMLKSTIRQLIISDPTDLISIKHTNYNLAAIKKPLKYIDHTSTNWISEL